MQDRVFDIRGKSHALTASFANHTNVGKIKAGAFRARSLDKNGKRVGWKETKPSQNLELRKDDKSNSLSSVQKDNVVVRTATIKKGGQGDRVYSTKGKGITLSAQSGGTAGNGNMLIGNELCWRKLTPVECERLQTVPDNYTDCVSNTQRYKMLGNGWTVDVVAHILKGINIS